MWPGRTLDVVTVTTLKLSSLLSSPSLSSSSPYHHMIILPVSCGRPITPDNGSIEAYQNTNEGAEIFFRCNPGYVPAGRMRAVCATDGSWTSDPAALVCTGVLVV